MNNLEGFPVRSVNCSGWLRYNWRTGDLFQVEPLLTAWKGSSDRKKLSVWKFRLSNCPGIPVMLTPPYRRSLQISGREMVETISSPKSPQHKLSDADLTAASLRSVITRSPVCMRPSGKRLCDAEDTTSLRYVRPSKRMQRVIALESVLFRLRYPSWTV